MDGLGLDLVEEAVAAIAHGELVVVVDDTDRENEGDLVMAAQFATPATMAFMIRHTSGIVCAALTAPAADRLNLPPMVANNLDPLRTAFTVSVDVRAGMTTGVSALERANTARALADLGTEAHDLVRPGHVFPLIAREGGVLTRSGHTEAANDLCILAGVEPVGVLAELVHDDGSMRRLPALASFAREHGLKIISIGDLIAYRTLRETFVGAVRREAMTIARMPGLVTVFATPFDDVEHIAAVFGEVDGRDAVPVRIHRERPIADAFGGAERRWLDQAVEVIRAEGQGVLVLLRTAAVDELEEGHPGEQHGSAVGRRRRWRDAGIGAQILRELGVRSVREIATEERGYLGLSGFGVDVTDRILVDA